MLYIIVFPVVDIVAADFRNMILIDENVGDP
jgi:hypothetical protein